LKPCLSAKLVCQQLDSTTTGTGPKYAPRFPDKCCRLTCTAGYGGSTCDICTAGKFVYMTWCRRPHALVVGDTTVSDAAVTMPIMQRHKHNAQRGLGSDLGLRAWYVHLCLLQEHTPQEAPQPPARHVALVRQASRVQLQSIGANAQPVKGCCKALLYAPHVLQVGVD
jgi:hypothetical protein